MVKFREEKFSKFLILFLAFLFVFQGDFSFAQASPDDPFPGIFLNAKGLYLNEKYEDAKSVLEKMVSDLAEIKGRETLKGETYLLIGAVYEKLKFKKLASKYYCLAKDLLGKGKSFEGLKLKDLKYYKKKCPRSGVVVRPGVRHKSGFGRLLGSLLGLALIGGVIWYLFINKNSPLKNKEDSSTELTWSEIVSKYSFATYWKAHLSIVCNSGSSCSATLSPKTNWAPLPQQANNWDDSKTVSIVTTGSYSSLTLKIEVEISGCNNGKRRDIIYVDGNQVLDVTNIFTNSCDTNSMENSKKVYTILQKSGTKSFVLRHVVNLNGNNVADSVKVFSSIN